LTRRRVIDAPDTSGTEADPLQESARGLFYRHGAELEYQVKKAGEEEFKPAAKVALSRRYEYITHID
jgi:hypothetical protein